MKVKTKDTEGHESDWTTLKVKKSNSKTTYFLLKILKIYPKK